MSAITTATTLRCLPGAIGLPTVDPVALTMESCLRFLHVEYERQADQVTPQVHVKTVTTGAGAGAQQQQQQTSSPLSCTASSVEEVLSLLKSNGKDLESGITTDTKTKSATVELVSHTAFAAFNFLIMHDEGLVSGSIRRRVAAKVGGLTEALTGSLLRTWRSESACRLPPGTPATVGSALVVAKKALQSLSSILATSSNASSGIAAGGSSASPHPRYILGSATPTTADCFAYAAVSCLFHADFTTASSAELKAWQSEVIKELPDLVHYVETLRLFYFEEFSATYHLRPVDVALGGEGNNKEADVYAAGRWKALITTGLFALVYFCIVNADTVVALLGAEEEVDLEAAMSKPGTAGGEGGQQGEPPKDSKTA